MAEPPPKTNRGGAKVDRFKPALWIPLVLLIAGTLVLHFADLDIWLSAHCYDADRHLWSWRNTTASDVIDNLGRTCVAVPITLCLLFLVLGWRRGRRFSIHRRTGLFLLLALLACQMTINMGMKWFVDRPRPRHIVEFGGDRNFRAVLEPDFALMGDGNSFPSSHAAAGFSLLCLYFAFRRHWRKTAMISGLAGILFGLLVGVNRIVQGAHFTSDIIWAFGTIYFTNLLIYRLWYSREDPLSNPVGGGDRREAFDLRQPVT